MATPVVQGTPVSSPYGGETTGLSTGPGVAGTGTEQHEPKKTGCKDPLFAILFYVNVAAIIAVCSIYGKDALNSPNNSTFDYEQLAYGALVFGAASLVFSMGGLLFLMQYPAFMIKCGLIFVVIMSLVSAIYIFISPGGSLKYFWGALAILCFLGTCCYARYAWSRIPFAAINMVTAATAIKANLGVAFFAIFFGILQIVWTVLWTVAYMGVFDITYNCQGNQCTVNYGYLFLLFLSFFFGQQVLQYSVHVIVAGTVGTWWVAPDESGFCSRGVCTSFIRAVTTSFGSICMGSLLVAVIRALKALAQSARSNDDGGFLVCIAECILGCLANCLEYFNKWAYIYVGIYGDSYVESAKAVMQLFADRGWDAVVADDLVGNAITLTALVSGFVIGAVGVGYAAANDQFNELTGNNLYVAFTVGLFAGVSICSILLGTIASGVNTVIVMFAEAPAEFEQNHPELSQEMRSKWLEFYPGLL